MANLAMSLPAESLQWEHTHTHPRRPVLHVAVLPAVPASSASSLDTASPPWAFLLPQGLCTWSSSLLSCSWSTPPYCSDLESAVTSPRESPRCLREVKGSHHLHHLYYDPLFLSPPRNYKGALVCGTW